MRNIKLTIEYDGTNYHGWQSQNNAITVQDVMIQAIEKLTGESCILNGSSRTDTGVHAIGQVANFHTSSKIPEQRFSRALNCILPEDIVVKKSEEVSPDFHARFSAKGKKYKYLILNAPTRSAVLRNRVCYIKSLLDFEAMRKALGYFLGNHDFLAFKASGNSVKSTVRTITNISLEQKNDLIELNISGDGFLYNMVRIISGTLIEVGQKKIRAEDIENIIRSLDRKMAGKTAPAQGLYLVEVYY